MIEYSMQDSVMNPNNSGVETIDDKQFYQLGSNLLQSIEVALEAAYDALDLDLDVERQGGNVIIFTALIYLVCMLRQVTSKK